MNEIVQPNFQILAFDDYLAILVKAVWLDYNSSRSGRSAVRLARTVRVREVPSSNLGAPTEYNFDSKSPSVSKKGDFVLRNQLR